MALIAADQRMPQMTRIELLDQARAHAPGAKLLLLTAYADTDVASKASNDIGLATAPDVPNGAPRLSGTTRTPNR